MARDGLVVILNQMAGANRTGLREEIEQLFRNHQLEPDIHEPATPAETAQRVRAAIDARVDAVVAAGGDGTVSAVASALAGGPTPLGVLPIGTLNHFAKDLGLPLDLPSAVDTIAAGRIRHVDVGRLSDRIFLNNASIGVYPSIVERRERLRQLGRGKWTAFVKATIEVLSDDEEVSIRLESETARVVARTPFLFVGNNEYKVEGLHLAERTRVDGGSLYAYFAPPVRTRDLPKLLVQALLGHARQRHAIQSISAGELWVETPWNRVLKVACDGEVVTLQAPLHFQIWPGALNVIVPA